MHRTKYLLLASGWMLSTPAVAQQPESEAAPSTEKASASASLSTSTGLTAEGEAKESEATPDPAQETEAPAYAGARAGRSELSLAERYRTIPYLERYKPESNLWEVGLFAGLLFPPSDHNLKVAVLPRDEYSPLAGVVGGSLAYFPLSWLGAELDVMGAGANLATSKYSAALYGGRVHGVLQLPLYSVVPFAFVGGGFLGASSEIMGHDRDPVFHFGAGVKVPFNHRVGARLDFRDTLGQKGNGAANGKQTHYPELHLGVMFSFERTPPPLPKDSDYDGLYDFEDTCATQGALTVDGCPADSDGDGIDDSKDACPKEAGTAPEGCPEEEPCEVVEAPPAVSEDADGDGLVGSFDKCPQEPETRNGFEDADGCPDEMPDAITKFTGSIQGIQFKMGTAEVEETSYPTLDSAVEILKKFPSIRLEVSGHTSSEGTEKRNQELSVQRAEAVKKYIVSRGINEERLVARGAGASEPVADNGTKEGREKNRRIEFRVLAQP